MAARTWTGLVDGDVTKAGNYDVLVPVSAPSGTDTLTIPLLRPQYPNTGVYPATGAVTIDDSGQINGGTFACEMEINGTIAGGTFSAIALNNGTISGGTFSASVQNNGTISGGTFIGAVHSDGTITGGTFEGAVAAHGAGSIISGGFFLGSLTYTAGTLVTGAASTIIAAASQVLSGKPRWTGATGADVGTLNTCVRIGD